MVLSAVLSPPAPNWEYIRTVVGRLPTLCILRPAQEANSNIVGTQTQNLADRIEGKEPIASFLKQPSLNFLKTRSLVTA